MWAINEIHRSNWWGFLYLLGIFCLHSSITFHFRCPIIFHWVNMYIGNDCHYLYEYEYEIVGFGYYIVCVIATLNVGDFICLCARLTFQFFSTFILLINVINLIKLCIRHKMWTRRLKKYSLLKKFVVSFDIILATFCQHFYSSSKSF